MPDAATPQPPVLRRLLVFALLGPPIGAATLLALLPVLMTGSFDYGAVYDHPSVATFVAFLVPAYFLGLIPALAIGVLDAALVRRTGPALRAAITGLGGALLSLLPIAAALAAGFLHGPAPFFICLAGLVAGPLCSLLATFLFERKPA